MLEIGAGTGLLTAELDRRGARVHAIELDARLAAHLRDRFHDRPRVEVRAGDGAAVQLPPEPFRVVANLPFHRTSAILRHLLDDPRTPLRRADVIVEWGVALKRAAVWPSTLRGAYWGAWYGFAVARHLPRLCFSPPPSVDAGVLVVVRRPEPLVPVQTAREFRDLLAIAFAAANAPVQRTLAASSTPRQLRRLLDATGAPRAARPRDLDAHQWARLFAGVAGAVRRSR